jgi:hypothetical protein
MLLSRFAALSLVSCACSRPMVAGTDVIIPLDGGHGCHCPLCSPVMGFMRILSSEVAVQMLSSRMAVVAWVYMHALVLSCCYRYHRLSSECLYSVYCPILVYQLSSQVYHPTFAGL